MDNEFDPSQAEVRDAIDQVRFGTRAHAITNLDANPEDGARALELGEVSGLDPTLIHDDLPGFESKIQSSMLDKILDGNPQIGTYIRSHPLASVVSNDDYGNLDYISRSVPNHDFFDALIGFPVGMVKQGAKIVKTLSDSEESGVDTLIGAIPDAILGGARGIYDAVTAPPEPGHFDEQGKWVEADWQAQERIKKDYNPVVGAGLRYMYGVKDIGKRAVGAMMGGMFGAPVAYAKSVAKTLGLSDTEVEQIGRDFEAGLTNYLAQNEAPEHIRRLDANIQNWKNIEATIEVMDDVSAVIKPWVDAGLTPPRGLHPAVDKHLTDVNTAVVDQLMKNLDAVQSAATKERSEELMKGFLNQYYEDATIGINPHALAALYGGKVPEAGDGLLGFVPDLAEKTADGTLHGLDVHVPLKDWLTKVDPAVAKQLKDDLRVGKGLITANEAKEPVEAPPTVDAALARARAVNGTEPLFAQGDKRLDLVRTESKPGFEDFHNYQFLDGEGKPAGELVVHPEKDALSIEEINGLAGLHANSFGPSLMKHLIRQLKEAYPEYLDEKGKLKVRGFRVSGAREAAGAVDTHGKVEIKLGPGEEGENLRQLFEEKFADKFAGLGDPDKFSISATPAGDVMYLGNRVNETTGMVEPMLEPLGQAIPIRQMLEEHHAEAAPEVGSTLDTATRVIADVLDRLGMSNLRAYLTTHPDSYFKDWGGFYNSRGPAVLVRPGSATHRLRTTVHEGTHAAFFKVLHENKEIRDTVDEMVIYTIAITGKTEKDHYGLTDAQEFVAEAFASDKFREFLSTIEVPKEWLESKGIVFDGTIKSVYDWFLDTVRKALGLDATPETRTMLDAVLKYSEQIEGAAKEGKSEGKLAFADNDNLTRAETLDQARENLQTILDRLTKEEYNAIDVPQLQKLAAGNLRWHPQFKDMTPLQRLVHIKNAQGKLIIDAVAKLRREKLREDSRGPAFGPKEEPTLDSINEQLKHIRATTVGLPVKVFEKMQGLLKERYKLDVAADQARAAKNIRKTQTKEWKEASKILSQEVEKNIRNRPDVLADLLIGAGELAGHKSDKMFHPLRAADLTDEQKAGLPRRYYSENGLPADQVANLVGFHSGDAMIEALIEYNKGREGLTSKEHLKKVIDAETARQMAIRHGDLDKNIMEEAQDQALSENDVNLIQQEWQGAAMQAGVSAIDKDLVHQVAMDAFNRMKVGGVSYEDMQKEMLKHYDQAVREMAAQNYPAAVDRLQRRYQVAVIAKEVKKLEKSRAALDKTAKWARKREIASMDIDWTHPLHDVLDRVEYKLLRTSDDIKKELKAAGHDDLKDFAEYQFGQMRPVQIWDELFDPTFRKKIDEMTPEEFYAVKDTVDSLVSLGREEKKVNVAGNKVDWANKRAELVDRLTMRDEVDYDAQGMKKGGVIRKGIDTFVGMHINMQNTMNRWDGYDPMGVWQQTVLRGLHEGAGDARRTQKEVSEILRKKIAGLSKKALNKKVENTIFKFPHNDKPMPLTRKNMLMIALNSGTVSNRVKMAKGYKTTPEAMMAWLDKNMTKADWDFVQGMWTEVFKHIKSKHDTMMRSMGAMPVKDIPASKVYTKFGEYEGGYFPVIPHPEFSQTSTKLMGGDPLTSEHFFSLLPDPGFTKDRSGWVGPVALSLDELPNRIGQVIHDIAMRPGLVNAHKVFKDPVIKEAIYKHYGAEVRDELFPYLRGLANAASYNTKAMSTLDRWSEFFRGNVVSSLIMGNMGTFLKHTPTALGTSLKEVSPNEFRRGAIALFGVDEKTGEKNYELMMRLSNEMPLRDRNWMESIYGASNELTSAMFGGKYATLRQKIMQYGTKPIAVGDFLSAGPTWMGVYLREIDKGTNVGDAVYLADNAVRRAHGSMSPVNRSAVQRDMPRWLTSIFNFWSDIMNRQIETMWKAGEMVGAVKKGEWKEAASKAKEVAAGTMAYVLWPALIEHMVTGADEEDSWGADAAKALTHTLAGGWFGLRDFASAMFYDRDPQVGLAGTAFNMGRRVLNDIIKSDDPWASDNRSRLIQHGSGLIGGMFGVASEPIGRGLGYIYDVKTGEQSPPQGPWEWAVGVRYGRTEGHSTTAREWKERMLKQ